MTSKWQKLPIVSRAAPPTLLYSFTTTADTYELYITDLVHLWTEKLSRRDIIHRATVEETSIDPGEDSDQFKIFLQKLQEALAGTKKSEVSLRPGVGRKSNDFDVITTTELPAPLEPLVWVFHATQESATEFTTQLIVPLLQAQVEANEVEQSLLKILKEKDWILGKIFDKIQSLGVDLSAVFPGTVGLRSSDGGMSRTRAAKYIPGLAVFDESTWREGIDTESTALRLTNALIESVSDQSSKRIQLEKVVAPNENWWKNSNNNDIEKSARSQRRKSKSPVGTTPRNSLAGDRESSDEYEFQRQETPPRLKKKTQHHEADVSSDRGSNSDEPRPPTNQSSQPTTHRREPASMGKIGGKRDKGNTEPVPMAMSENSSRQAERTPADEETESEDDELRLKSRSTPGLRTSGQDDKKDRLAATSKLGSIGGRKAKVPISKTVRATQSTDDEAHSPPPASSESLKSPPKKGAGFGVIGGKKTQIGSRHPQPSNNAADSTASEDDLDDLDSAHRSNADTTIRIKASSREPSKPSISSSPSPSTKPTSPKEPERELTTEEKANRKREELKRELEAKSKGPSKKKRKF